MRDTAPEAWEAEVATAVADRIRRDARAALAAGRWTPGDVHRRLAAAERRLTAAQRDVLWMSVVADVELAELAERVPE